MKDPELDILIKDLETKAHLSLAEYDGIAHALAYLLPEAVPDEVMAPVQISTTDGAVHVADVAYPNWVVNIHGRANEKNGNWRCTLRESDVRDSDTFIGTGNSPVLAQAILAAVLRLAATRKKD